MRANAILVFVPAVLTRRFISMHSRATQGSYEQEQNIKVLKVSKGFDALLTDLPKVDAAHQCQLRNACIAVLVKHGIMQNLY